MEVFLSHELAVTLVHIKYDGEGAVTSQLEMLIRHWLPETQYDY